MWNNYKKKLSSVNHKTNIPLYRHASYTLKGTVKVVQKTQDSLVFIDFNNSLQINILRAKLI